MGGDKRKEEGCGIKNKKEEDGRREKEEDGCIDESMVYV